MKNNARVYLNKKGNKTYFKVDIINPDNGEICTFSIKPMFLQLKAFRFFRVLVSKVDAKNGNE